MIYLTLHIIQNKVSLQGLNDAKRQPTSVTVCSSCCHLAKDTQLSDALTIPDYGAGSFSSTFTLHLLSFYGFFFSLNEIILNPLTIVLIMLIIRAM